MWLKISTVNSKEKEICFPCSNEFTGDKVNISFGSRSINTKINCLNNNEPRAGYFPDKPLEFQMTSKLQEELLIPDSSIYQYTISKNNLRIGPVIAFLLGNYEFTPKHMKKYNDRSGIFDHIGGLIFAFSPDSIDFKNNSISGLFYNSKKAEWESGNFPFPSFIYRRNFSTTCPEIIKKLNNICENNLFNSYRFSKMELYNLLNKNEEFKQYIPPTKKLNNSREMSNFIEKHESSILKPVSSSRGRGIFIIKKSSEKDYKLIAYSRHAILNKQDLIKALERNHIFSNNYLIQKYLDLEEINNSIFDLRVVMQKPETEKWQCTGIEVRKAKKGQHLTNISRGGTALSFPEASQKVFSSRKESENFKNKVLGISKKFCAIMDETEENYCEFGLDIALDKNKKSWFLEANVLPAFEGFKKIDYENYLSIRYNPLKFAASRTGFQIK